MLDEIQPAVLCMKGQGGSCAFLFCSMILLSPLYLRMLIRATTTLASEALPLAMAITSPVVMRFDFC